MKKVLTILATIWLLSNSSFGQCYSAGEHLPKTGLILESSGYYDLDSLVFAEIDKLEKFFKVDIDFYFLLEDYGKNAMYLRECNHSCQGTICLGIKMLYSELHKTNGIYTTKAILAHEFGHCIQHIIGWNEQWKRPELHSDFMSGYYLGRNYNYTPQELDVLFRNFFEMGDNDYWSVNHHGTGVERECAFREGYCYAKETSVTPDIANAYAVKYVVADNPCGIRKYKAWEKQVMNDPVKSEEIKKKNKGQNEIKNLATTQTTVTLTFKSESKLYHKIYAPGIGFLGEVTKDRPLIITVDKYTEYKFLCQTHRRTLFGNRGSLKSEKWRLFYSEGFNQTLLIKS
jgi:hypothetical protein